MSRMLTILFLVLAFSLQATAQSAKGLQQPNGATSKKHTQTKTFSIAELHDIARGVSVEIMERTQEAPGFGTWVQVCGWPKASLPLVGTWLTV